MADLRSRLRLTGTRADYRDLITYDVSSQSGSAGPVFVTDRPSQGLILLAPAGGQDHRTPRIAAHAHRIRAEGWTVAVVRSLDAVPRLLAEHAGSGPVGLLGVGQGARLGRQLLTAEPRVRVAVLAPVHEDAKDGADTGSASVRYVAANGGLPDPETLEDATHWLLDRLAEPPLVCLAGGPMLPPAYLGDLAGLSDHRRLTMPDLREHPDPRCDRLVSDLETLREELGLERLDLLAHSAGANLAYRYAERHPDRVGRLVLVTPSVLGLGIDISDDARSEIARSRTGEPWYAEAADALARVQAGRAEASDWAAITPFTHGRWDAETRDYDAWMDAQRDPAAAAAYGADGAFDPQATRAALAGLDAPVLVVTGAVDVGNPPAVMQQVADLFPRAELVVQDGAAHYPWRDDPERFVASVAPFLGGG